VDAIEIRAPREEEFPTVLRIANVAFGEESTPEDVEAYRKSWPCDRALCAYEAGKMVASSAVLTMELTLPGHVAIPAGGVTWIATLPTHRRRGLLRRLMVEQFGLMAQRDEPVSVLFASEAGIYGRFGYGPATSTMSFALERACAAFSTPAKDQGAITLLDQDEAAAQLPAVYEDLRLAQHGAVSRPAAWWIHHLHDPLVEREGATSMLHALHTSATRTADGYVSYRLKREWSAGGIPANEVLVVELLAADPTVYKSLWNYVLSTDLAKTISCWRGRFDEPLRWLLTDPRRFQVRAMADDLYLRVHDVPRALAARAYGAGGELVLSVTDTFPHLKRTCYLLHTGGSGTAPAPGAECAKTTREPDLELSIDYLGAVYLGGVSFANLAAAGRIQEYTPGAVQTADRLFSTVVAPFCATMF